jgi:outer membrane protein OmpA-like peptidoglycan-associated protein
MAENWLADVRIYDADADEGVVAAIVKYCGIALQNRDSSLVAMSDKKERVLVRENYLKKKLGLTDSDETLDAAVLSVGEVMKADRTKNRVTVYYLLAKHFGLLSLFGGVDGSGGGLAAAGAAVAGAAGLAASTDTAAASTASAAAAPLAAMSAAPAAAVDGGPDRSSGAAAAHPVGDNVDDGGFFGWGCGVAALALGAIILAALLAWWVMRDRTPPAAAPAPAVVAAAPAAAPAPAPIPEGAGVVAAERAEKPMLTVYFDTGKSAVSPDFPAASAAIKDYMAKNPDAKLAVSGFNDPTGNAAANAELSKKRAQAVKAALEKEGIAAASVELVKPAEATDASGDNTNARRVEVVVQ